MSVRTSIIENVWSQIKQIYNFTQLQIVGRCSETQLQAGKNLT